MKSKFKLLTFLVLLIITISYRVFAITPVDNGVMQIYTTRGGLEFDALKGFDIKGYITTGEHEKTLISSTFGNYGYHTFLNVNGLNGEMQGVLSGEDEELEQKAIAMQYTAVEGEGWQNINGINIKISTNFINGGEQLQIVYTLKNTTSTAATISLATTADVQIDGDDHATIERLEDGSGVRLWTKEGRHTDKPVQFVFYGRGVTGTTSIDNLWIGYWGNEYYKNMFNDNSSTNIIENQDSAFTYSWVNRNINAGETQTYKVLMEVGEVNTPNTGITLDNNTKFYYQDVKINGTIKDEDLRDEITVHYVVDGTEYTLPKISTTGTDKEFVLDLTNLNLSAVDEHTLKVWATDTTGCESNVEERVFTVTYLKNPEVSVSETEWTKEDVTFRITDEENVQQYVDKYQYRINNGAWIDCEKDTDNLIEENGMIQIDVRIVGTEENDYSDIITVNAKIDKVEPTKTVPTANKTTCSITINSAQTDEHSGIDETKTMYAIKDSHSWSEWQSSNTFEGLTHNKEYIVKTKSADMVGNVSESEELIVKTDELIFGNLILRLNNSEGANYTENTWTNKNIYVAIEELTPGATTKYYSKENSAQIIEKTNQETTVTKNGTTILLLLVTDGTNTITSDVEHILKVDKIAPIINELTLDNDEWTTTEKNITGKAIDELSGIVAYQFSKEENITSSATGWNSITKTNSQTTQTTTVTESGKHYFHVLDEAGNVGTVGIDTKIDALGPVITFIRENGETAISVTDTGSGIKNKKYAWTTENQVPGDAEWQNYTQAVTYPGTSDGIIYLWAKAEDNLANETISSTVFNAILEPTIISEDMFTNQYASFKLNSENLDDDVSYQFNIDDGEWKNITENSAYSITNVTEGEIKITARVFDNAGRYSENTEKTVSVLIVEPPQEEPPADNNPGTNELPGGNLNNTNKVDETIAGGGLPYTGTSAFVVLLIVVLVAGVIVCYRKVTFYKDIK